MAKFKFYVLTSRRLDRLKRHIDPNASGIEKEDLVVVINSLNKTYVEAASEWCAAEGIEYYITESDGSAGKGKNSVLNIFLSKDDDYFVLVDGDDYLTPHGVWMYKHISKTESPPDCICLYNQIALVVDAKKHDLIRRKVEEQGYDSLTGEDLHVKPQFPFTVSSFPPLSRDVEHTASYTNPSKSVEYREMVERNKYYRKQELYSEKSEAHCRVTWYSRKAAAVPFNEDILIGEDTIQYLSLKNEAYHGRLDMVCTDEMTPTYIYDNSIPGVVCDVSGFGSNNFNWMFAYNAKVSDMEREGLLAKAFYLPELEVEYPPDYLPEVYGVVDDYVWVAYNDAGDRVFLKHPANSTQESLIKKSAQTGSVHTTKMKKQKTEI